MYRIPHHRSRSRGFTVVELLVAMAVFSVVLLVVTVAILQVSRMYYKGVTEANTQSVARSVIDTISQSIQFNGDTVTNTMASPTAGTSYAFCVNNQEYSYRPGYKLVDGTLGTNQTNRALVLRTVAACSSSGGQDLSNAASVTGRELLAPNLRLAKLVVENAGPGLYKVQVRVIHGDDDQLYSPSGNPAGALAPDATCHAQAGQQFCAVSDLSTVVISRVQ